MALTRQLLLDLGLEKDVMQKILDEHGETVKSAKQATKEELEDQYDKKIKKLEGEKADLENKAKDTPKDVVPKVDYDTLKKDFDNYKKDVETEKTTSAKRTALHSHLKNEGANEKLIELLESKFDLEKIELDGDKIKDWSSLVKPIKEQFSEVFGTVETEGAGAANPPKGNGGISNPFIQGEHFSLQAQTKLYKENPSLAKEMAGMAGIKID